MTTSYSVRIDQDKLIEKATRKLGFKSKSAFVRYAVDGELARLGYFSSARVDGPWVRGIIPGYGVLTLT